MRSRSGRTVYKVKTIARLKDRKTGEVLKSYKEKGGGKKPLFGGKKAGGVMKAMGGKMAKGYSKGGSRMMRARGGKMAKGYAKGGTKMMTAMGGRMMKSKGYAKGGTKMMKAMGGRMAKGMRKGGPKVMKASLGGLTLAVLGKSLKAVKPGFKPSDKISRRLFDKAVKHFDQTSSKRKNLKMEEMQSDITTTRRKRKK
tara:strand:- start:33 stop:626 length:594 start_codon:yes stop_codon:yes gene_type:complete